ncbi:MAG: DNA polymerase III subunit delta [bacterium]
MGVYLLWGEDDFRLEKALISLRLKILGSDISPLNHRVLNNPDLNILLENIQTTGMMFGNLLIEADSKNLFLRTKEKVEVKSDYIDKIIDALEYLPTTVSVIFVSKIDKGSNKKVDGASKIVKAIKKIGEVQEFQQFKSYETKKLIEWINQNVKEKNLFIKSDAADELLLSVGEDLRRLDAEIDKLELLAYPEKTITKKMVAELGLSCDNIFTFADVLVSGNKEQSYIELNNLLEKDEPLKILAVLQTTLRNWLKLKIDSKTLSYFEIGQSLGKKEFWVQKQLEKLSVVSINDLISLQKKITETEFKIKTGKLEKKLALELML